MDNRSALETIALGYTQGIVSSDILIKACDNYKCSTGFVDDEDYRINVSKSLLDQLNGVEPNEEISKAILPGQTKFFNGVLYIYSKTKVGSKEEYGWHVARKSRVGKSSKVDDTTAKKLDTQINELFPTDINSIKIVKAVGGSTGAQLVQDSNKNEYIMKRATKVPAEHVRSEYIANMLYNILGQKTPDFELYNADSDTDITMLSRFIPGTKEPQSSDFAEMGKGFISDVLLANWDVYKNDNCRIDAGGNVIRVDNGASLFFRAQGGRKNPPFDDDVERTYNDMIKYNSLLAKCLVPKDLINQIDACLSKKDDIVNFLKESNQTALADIMDKRIDNLKKIKDKLVKEEARKAALEAAKLGRVLPRKLKSAADMYVEFTDDQLDKMADDISKGQGISLSSALTDTRFSGTGWSLLSKICQERGFDGRPRVVTETQFWQEAKNATMPIMLRGVTSDGGKSAKDYADAFRYDDKCYYGTQAAWGQGIYAHVDDTNDKWLQDRDDMNQKSGGDVDRNTVPYNPQDNKNNKSNDLNYKQFKAYQHAQNYSNSEKGGIIKMMWEPDAKVVDLDALLQEAKNDIPQADPKLAAQIKQVQQELADAKLEWNKAEAKLMSASDVIKAEVHKRLNYDEAAVSDMCMSIENTNWGNRAANGDPNYPKFDDFCLNKMSSWITKNGGKVEIGNNKEYVVFTIGGESMSISRYAWEHNAIKVKNSLTPPYNYHATLFRVFMETNCISRAEKAVRYAIDNSKNVIDKMKDDVQAASRKYYAKKSEYDTLSNASNTGNTIRGMLYNRLKSIGPRDSGEDRMGLIGLYAAVKGYDGIYVHNGNSYNHGFNVILNRTKVVTSVE